MSGGFRFAHAAAGGLLLSAGLAEGAQTIEALAVFPPSPIPVSAPVSLTVHAANPFDTPCGLRLAFGDGRKPKTETIGGPGKPAFPYSLDTQFAKAGTFRIRVEGAKLGKTPACAGSAGVTVVIKGAAR